MMSVEKAIPGMRARKRSTNASYCAYPIPGVGSPPAPWRSTLGLVGPAGPEGAPGIQGGVGPAGPSATIRKTFPIVTLASDTYTTPATVPPAAARDSDLSVPLQRAVAGQVEESVVLPLVVRAVDSV
jgi:hypothetical protein